MAETSTVKELELDGYKFTVDTDLLDDVDAFELIDRIENKGQVVAVVPLLKFLIGDDGLAEMKAFYMKADKEAHDKAHPEKEVVEGVTRRSAYKGKFRVSQLSKVYQIIIENFNPKD